VQVQNALNKRVNLQCTLLLTNLDLPLALNSAELQAREEVRRSEQLALHIKAESAQVRAQLQQLQASKFDSRASRSHADEVRDGHASRDADAESEWVVVPTADAARKYENEAEQQQVIAIQQQAAEEMKAAKQRLHNLELRLRQACA
jgi:hypothetical protein